MKAIWWLVLNLVLAPLYLILALLAISLSVMPLTPPKTARRNLQQRLGVSAFRAVALTALTLYNYALAAIELVILGPLGATFRLNEKECWAFLDYVVASYNLKQNGRGLLFVGGHYAAIEEVGIVMNGYWLPFRGNGITALAKPASFRLGTILMDAYRRSRNLQVIWTGQGRPIWEQIKELLESGGALGLVADQKARKGGLFLRFFGEYSSFPYRGLAMGQSLKVPCIAINVRRLLPGIFRVEYALLPPAQDEVRLARYGVVDLEAFRMALNLRTLDYKPAEIHSNESNRVDGSQDAEGQAEIMMAHYVGWLETLIRKSPYQWCWDYRKWSRRPMSP